MTSIISTFFYVGLLLINAMAILNEERFLARIGWSSSKSPAANPAYHQTYEQPGFGAAQADIGIKAKIIDLISAVRTLMRIPLIGVNIIVIMYEIIMG